MRAYFTCPAIFEDLFASAWRRNIDGGRRPRHGGAFARAKQALAQPSACRRAISFTRPSCKGGGVFRGCGVISVRISSTRKRGKGILNRWMRSGWASRFACAAVWAARCRPCARSVLSAIWRIRCARMPGAPLILCSSGYGGLPLSRAHEAAQRFRRAHLGVSGVTEQTRARLALYLGLKEKVDVTARAEDDFRGFASCHELPSGKVDPSHPERNERGRPRGAGRAVYRLVRRDSGWPRVTQCELLADTGIEPAPLADDFRRGRGGL